MPGKPLQFKIRSMVRSEAKKIFHLFRPNEPIVGEGFDLGLAITNLNQETYEDGYVSCILKYANADVQPCTLKFSFDDIRPNEEKESWLIDQTAFGSGAILLHGFELISKGQLVARGDYDPGSTIPCHSFINTADQIIDKDNPLIFNVANREELYQKYSVVIAIWTSTVATIIATIGIITAIIF